MGVTLKPGQDLEYYEPEEDIMIDAVVNRSNDLEGPPTQNTRR